MQADVLFRAALCTVTGRPLDIEGNAEDMARTIERAEQEGAGLVVFALESISAHTAGDLLLPGLKQPLYRAVRRVAEASGRALCLYSFRVEAAGRQTVAVAAARDGRLWAVGFPQLTRETMGPFAEEVKDHLNGRAAVAGAPNFPLSGGEDVVGVLLYPDAQRGAHLMDIGATALVLMEAVPTQAEAHRADAARALSFTLKCPVLSVNAGSNESTTDAVYGGERALAHSGGLLLHAQAFDPVNPLLADIPMTVSPKQPPLPPTPHPRMPFAPQDEALLPAWCRAAGEITARGLAARLMRARAQTAVLGLSGGLDSAMALLTARRALSIAGLAQDRLLAYSLPAFGTGQRTRQNALRLMAALGLPQREIDISDHVAAHLRAIGHDGRLDAAYENAQARERTQVLMDLCNTHGGLMVGPGDMSELALGFTTYGGDHMSMYGVNAGLPKTAIRLMLRQAALDTDNTALSEVLTDILRTPISPELLPGGSASQQTERILGSYEVNDCILWHVLGGADMQTVLAHLAHAFPELEESSRREALKHFMRRFVASQFKRSCLPDGPMALGKSLSPRGGLTMPSDADSGAWLKAMERSEPHA